MIFLVSFPKMSLCPWASFLFSGVLNGWVCGQRLRGVNEGFAYGIHCQATAIPLGFLLPRGINAKVPVFLTTPTGQENKLPLVPILRIYVLIPGSLTRSSKCLWVHSSKTSVSMIMNFRSMYLQEFSFLKQTMGPSKASLFPMVNSRKVSMPCSVYLS